MLSGEGEEQHGLLLIVVDKAEPEKGAKDVVKCFAFGKFQARDAFFGFLPLHEVHQFGTSVLLPHPLLVLHP